MPQAKSQPCPVCGDPCIVKFTHKGKPYWQCDPCGVQVFVRRQAGIDRFNRTSARSGQSAASRSPARDEFWDER